MVIGHYGVRGFRIGGDLWHILRAVLHRRNGGVRFLFGKCRLRVDDIVLGGVQVVRLRDGVHQMHVTDGWLGAAALIPAHSGGPAADEGGRGHSNQKLSRQGMEEAGAGMNHRGFRDAGLGHRPGEDFLAYLFLGFEPLQQGDQQRQRRQTVELDALLFQTLHRGFDLFPAAEQLGLDGAGRDAQIPGDLTDGELLIIVHGHDCPLAVGELVQDLIDIAGGLLTLQRQLRLGVSRKIGLLRKLLAFPVPQLGKEDGRGLTKGGIALLHRDTPEPGLELFRFPEAVQMREGVNIYLLLDVLGHFIAADHGPGCAVDVLPRRLVERSIGRLVSRLRPLDQAGKLSRFLFIRLFGFHLPAPPLTAFGLCLVLPEAGIRPKRCARSG